MNRVAWAHLPWSGGSLCGDTTTLEACPECVRRLLSLLLVHVQSLRRPHKSFCGRVISRRSDDLSSPVVSGLPSAVQPEAGPRLFWVTPDQAREILRARRAPGTLPPRDWRGWPVVPPICQACEANLVRFDDAHLRGARRPDASIANGERGELGAPPPRGRNGTNGRNGVARKTSGSEP